MTRVTVLIPTHDHAETLPYTVRSVLAQTHSDLEVIIVGDGVDGDVRTVATALVSDDPRVIFLDQPKGPHHGEIYRHDAILQATGEVIAYLCDDDLLLPTHVAQLVELLETHDFVQSLNGTFSPDGRVTLHVGDLADPEFVASVCDPTLAYNFVSITGTAHTRAYYERAGAPWHTTPEGEFPDQHQWRRMLTAVPPRAATSAQMTALQFPTHVDGRAGWSGEERLREISHWADVITAPDGQERIDALVREAARRQLLRTTMQELLLRRALHTAHLPLWRRALGRIGRRVRSGR